MTSPAHPIAANHHRYVAVIGYDGGAYCGWQQQSHQPSVQAAVERALKPLCGADVRLFCAGRTDAGVHALAQVVHFDSPVARDPETWVRALNVQTPRDIVVNGVTEVGEDFHARFSAHARAYLYVIDNHPRLEPWWQQRAWCYPRTLDAASMHEAAQHWLGEHDFSALRASHCQSRTPWRHLQEITVTRHGHYIQVKVQANAFLHHMVRNMIGVLVAIGRGDQPPSWAAEVLASGDRCQAGITAPPQGLYLRQVFYYHPAVQKMVEKTEALDRSLFSCSDPVIRNQG